jgi:hypothetical protein
MGEIKKEDQSAAVRLGGWRYSMAFLAVAKAREKPGAISIHKTKLDPVRFLGRLSWDEPDSRTRV